MNVQAFIWKWSKVALTERSASQQHFLDLCEVVGHGKPAELDPEGDSFTFEKGAAKYGGGRGWADVWKRGFFAWEYKGHYSDLAAAYDQLLRYREDIETLVEPVVLQPLRREWAEVRQAVESLLATGKKNPTEKDRRKPPIEGGTVAQGPGKRGDPLRRRARLALHPAGRPLAALRY